MEGKWSLLSREQTSSPPVSGIHVADNDGFGAHLSAFLLGYGRNIIRSDVLPFARLTLCSDSLPSPRWIGLLVLTLTLALSLSKVNNEADIFYLYIDIYILKQRSPAFADYNQFLRLMVVERLTVSKNWSMIFELFSRHQYRALSHFVLILGSSCLLY